MPDTSLFADMGTRLLGRLASGTVYIVIALLMGGIIFSIAWYVRYRLQFNILAEIKSTRYGADKYIDDKAARIWSRKDKRYKFRLLYEKVELPPPPNICLLQGAGGRNKIKIWNPAPNIYHYMLPNTVDVKKIIRDGVELNVPEEQMKVIEGGDLYWNILRKKDNRKLFDMESLVWKILPLVGIFLMFMAVIFLTYMITDKWSTFQAAAEALKEAAFAIRDSQVARVATG